MVRFSFILIFSIALDWLGAPASARAQDPLAGCKGYNAQNLQIKQIERTTSSRRETRCPRPDRLRRPAVDGGPPRELPGRRPRRRDGTRGVRVGQEPYLRRAHGVQHKTRTGTFYQASGNSMLRDAPDPGMFGTQEPDAFFWGDEIQKIGPKKYRIVPGGFTTCVQPTPRWELSAANITLTLDDYALLKNAVLKVKNVPMFYLPAFYYPIRTTIRATGFLMPIYTSSETRGQQISNQFFLGHQPQPGRDHRARLFFEDRAAGRRRVSLHPRPRLEGHSQFSFLNEHPTKYAQADGTEVTYPGTRSYAIVGDMAQRFPSAAARANANYTSSIVSQQRYHQNILQSTNRTRRFGGNLSGSWNAYSVSLPPTGTTTSTTRRRFRPAGSLPRVTVSRTETAIKGCRSTSA
jgi:hypothetical protein